MLFYARQKVTDLLTQMAVNVQGYLALDLVRKNNLELAKGVDRATTTTVSALRTAVIVAQALAAIEIMGVFDSVTASIMASELGVVVEPSTMSTLFSEISLRVLVTAAVVSEASSSTM